MSLSMDIGGTGFHIDAPIALPADQVQLWSIDLVASASEEARWLTILSPDERTRAVRFHFPIDRRYYAATRAILRLILGGYLSKDPAKIAFFYSSKEKPALGGVHADSGIEFNVSHSGDIALLAFTRNRHIGVDVEKIRDDFDTAPVAARFFSQVERDQLADLSPEHRHEAFFRCWTRKEAYIKATGDGLSLPLRQFDVSLAPHATNALLATRPDELESKRWSLRDLPVKSGYAGAVCAAGNGWHLADWSGRRID